MAFPNTWKFRQNILLLVVFQLSSLCLVLWYNMVPCVYYNTFKSYARNYKRKTWKATLHSKFHGHSSPIFKHLNIVKLPDLVFFNIAGFMHRFHNGRLPSVFDTFCTQVSKRHNYNTRSASNLFYTFPKVRSNYGIFNITFKCLKYGTQLVKIWKPSLLQTSRNQ